MQIKSFLGDCICNEKERSYSLEQKPHLEAQQEKRRAQMKQLSSSSKETPGTNPQHSVENPTRHHHLTQTTSSAASAHTGISDCQGLFQCQAHTTGSSLPRQACLHLYKPHRRYLMLPRAPCWPQLCCPHGEASAAWGLLQQPKAAPALWGCTFLSWGQILECSTWCSGMHTPTRP